MSLVLREYRTRYRVSDEYVKSLRAKIPTLAERSLLVQGPTRFLDVNGAPMLVYLPGLLTEEMDAAYPILTKIRGTTENRGDASGTDPAGKHAQNNMVRSKPVTSNILGAFEASGYYKYCRLTSWTSKQMETQWPELFPLLQRCAGLFEEYQPDRYAVQMREAAKTAPDWVIPGTPFTTVTVNNSYSTGMHFDDGDLGEGFSVLAVARKGEYDGGILTLPEAGVGVDMQHGDVVLMNAHGRLHGNTRMECKCGNVLSEGPCAACGAERISVVLYFRTKMVACGTKSQEDQKALERAEALNAGAFNAAG